MITKRFNSAAAATVEHFKPIQMAPRYQVSDKANVRNARSGRILKPREIPSGHRQVLLYRDDDAPIYDYVHRLIVAVVPGKRTAEDAAALVDEFHRRTAGRPMDLITTDEYAPYREAILRPYGETVTPPRTGRRGRPRKSYKVASANLLHAMVHKTRHRGRVVKVEPRVIFGTAAALKAAPARSASSRAVDASFVERRNGTDRNATPARSARRTASRSAGTCTRRPRI
jgi:hypothetical protein